MSTIKYKYNKWKTYKKLKKWGQYTSYYEFNTVNLTNKGLKKIPEWVGGLKDLKILNVEFNNIQEIPDWMGELKNLARLDLDHNHIKKIPIETLKKCDSLRTLKLINNPVGEQVEKASEKLNIEVFYIRKK